ncbi:MAG TPA: radical SAM protein [Thermodesulfobacteriota bacterium]
MIGISRLYTSRNMPADGLRYGRQSTAGLRPSEVLPDRPATAAQRRPVVVWNVGRRCNLHCRHCYSDSANRFYPGELTTEEGLALIDDLADFGIPVLLLSGGEPLMRPDIFDFIARAKARRLRTTLSTNGTLITPEVAERLKAFGLGYVGISLDGIGDVNDRFRGHKGAFEKAVAGFRACRAVGQRVGLRMTLTRHNVLELPRIFEFVETEGIDRVCFYHLVDSGRGTRDQALDAPSARAAIDAILDWTRSLADRGKATEVLTVDNPCDGPYIYMRLLREDPARAAEALTLLTWNGGGLHGSGIGVGAVDFLGNVHPDQFWSSAVLGNVRERRFSEIWQDGSLPLLAQLRSRAGRLGGRCGACQWLDVCGGGFRVRALAAHGDPWAEDPACYLTDAECGLVPGSRVREPFAAHA